MTAPLFHLSAERLRGVVVGDSVILDGPEAHHATKVMRLSPGEDVLLSDGVDTVLHGQIASVETGSCVVRITELRVEPELKPRLVLVQALAKDRRDIQAIESATELGVSAVIPWQAERSIAKWKSGREEKKHADWVSTVTTAAKQTRRTSIPQVRELVTTSQYLAQCAAQLQTGTRAVLMLHESQRGSLTEAVAGIDAAVTEIHLVVGPEGGISDAEARQFRDAGAHTVQLGSMVMRSSTAGPAALAALQLALGRWV